MQKRGQDSLLQGIQLNFLGVLKENISFKRLHLFILLAAFSKEKYVCPTYSQTPTVSI